ncbi:MAG: DNA repair protein RecO [Candidatus Marinamargulisbacteria bacterium]
MIQSEAIVLSVNPVFERDLLVELFTKDRGRIRTFAKYAQSKKPRFGALLTTFNWLTVHLIQGRTAYTLRHAQNIQSFNQLKTNYSKVALAYNMVSIIQTMTPLNMENPGLFELMTTALDQLNGPASTHDLMPWFCFSLLKNEGVVSEDMNLNEVDYKKMIESYTGMKLRTLL